MKLRLFQVDSFASRLFTGNPAAVCILPDDLNQDLAEEVMQQIAAENNLSETAFVRRGPKDSTIGGSTIRGSTIGGWAIRWFTPKVEVDLCGHATLAAGWAVLTHLEPQAGQVSFASRSGGLTVSRAGEEGVFTLDFPAKPARPSLFPEGLELALRTQVREVLATPDHYVAVLDRAAQVRDLAPDFAALAALKRWAVIVTAAGGEAEDEGGGCDFVSRFFAPRKGIAEDPVTGSAHCVLAPLWAKRLGKNQMTARQLSARGGSLTVELGAGGERVLISGKVVPYLDGWIEI